MPIYEYRCDNGHTFEAFQSMSDDALTECEVCEAPVKKLLSAPAIHYKGSGFYTTDYAKKGAKKPVASDGSKSSGSEGGSSGDSKSSKSDSGSSGSSSGSSGSNGSGSSSGSGSGSGSKSSSSSSS